MLISQNLCQCYDKQVACCSGCKKKIFVTTTIIIFTVHGSYICSFRSRPFRNLSQTILQTVTCIQVKFGPLQIWRFAVQITGEKWKAVALDKAHKMCINKDVEAAISHPTDSYLQKTSLFLHTRIQTQKSFLKDLFQKGM